MSEELDWSKCPFCGSGYIEAGDYDFWGNEVGWKVSCADCQKEWWEIYRASRREDMETGKELP